MSFRSTRSLLCVAIVGASASGLAMDFLGMMSDGGWPTSYLRARADWSSEIGPDYQCGYADNGSGTAVGWGEGTFTQSRPFQTFDSGYTAGWELDRKGGAAGQTFSGGQVTVGPGGVGSSWTSSWHMYSELGVNNPGMGISTDAFAATYYAFTPSPGEQLYWSMDWSLTVDTDGPTWASAWLNGLTYRNGGAGPPRTLINEWVIGGSRTITGSDFGGPASYGYSGNILPNFEIGTHLNDDANWGAGAGRMDLWVNIHFSTNAVPEPCTMSLATGLVGMAFKRLRRRRQSIAAGEPMG